MASLSILKKKERSGVLLNVTDHAVQLARMQRLAERPLVLDSLAEFPATDEEAVVGWLREKFPEPGTATGYLTGYCGFYPPERVFSREALNVRHLNEAGFLPRLVAEQAKSATPADWHAGAVNPLDGSPLTADSLSRSALLLGVSHKSIRDMQQRLRKWAIRPSRLEVGTLAMLGGVTRHVSLSGYPDAVVACEIGQTQTRIYLVGKDGVHTPPVLPHGLLSIEEAAMKELGAPDVGTARKQLAEGAEALKAHSRRLVRMLSRHLRPAVDYFEMQTGQRIGALFCGHLPSPLGWLEEALGTAVDLEFIQPDFSAWLPAAGLAVEGPPPTRSWLQPLSLVAHLASGAANAANAAAALPAAPQPAAHGQKD